MLLTDRTQKAKPLDLNLTTEQQDALHKSAQIDSIIDVDGDDDDDLLQPVNSPEELLESVDCAATLEFVSRRSSNADEKQNQNSDSFLIDTTSMNSGGQHDDELLTPVCSVQEMLIQAIESGQVKDSQALNFARKSTSDFEKSLK